ncbi:MAG: exo-alpha-sialidase [Gemmatimonadaceae bacterium]|nr:exo-alpha-sialidase [Gemmatimonadaceae bacterium]
MGIQFDVLEQGDVFRAPVSTPSSVAGPRCVIGRDGNVVCTFNAQSKLGINDFVPMITHGDSQGRNFSAATPIWPELREKYSIFSNVSRGRNAELFLFGTRTKIDQPGETYWSDHTKGLKANEFIWSSSRDDGRSFSPPTAFPLPYPGSAEVPGALLVTRAGRWIGPYSPYNLMDGSAKVQTERVIAVISDDAGRSWKPSVMIRFDEPQSVGAEAWVCELSDGRLLATAWHADMSDQKRVFPNKYAMSRDCGDTWSTTRSTGIIANTTALLSLSDNRALFITVRRRDDAGIWLSVVKPTDGDFGVLSDQCIWSAAQSTQSGGQANHSNWTDFTFGEPAAIALADGSLLLVFWYLNATHTGVKSMRLRMKD